MSQLSDAHSALAASDIILTREAVQLSFKISGLRAMCSALHLGAVCTTKVACVCCVTSASCSCGKVTQPPLLPPVMVKMLSALHLQVQHQHQRRTALKAHQQLLAQSIQSRPPHQQRLLHCKRHHFHRCCLAVQCAQQQQQRSPRMKCLPSMTRNGALRVQSCTTPLMMKITCHLQRIGHGDGSEANKMDHSAFGACLLPAAF